VPLCSVLVSILLGYLDTKAEKNMLADNKNQDSKPEEPEKVEFNIGSIINDLKNSLSYLSLELIVLFIMCICFYVGVFVWITQISDFFEVFKKIPDASNEKALLSVSQNYSPCRFKKKFFLREFFIVHAGLALQSSRWRYYQ